MKPKMRQTLPFATSVTGFYGTLFTSLGSKFTYTVEQERSTSFSKLRPGPQSDTTTLLSITPATRKEGKTIYDTLCMAESYISYNHLMNATTLKIAGFDTPKKQKSFSISSDSFGLLGITENV